jgi:EmrB/QacA subfamily drug resistance transporter
MTNPTSEPNAASPMRGPIRWVLASLSLAMLMSSLDTSIANAGLPTLARAFSASFRQVQWVVLAYLLAITTLIVGAGRLGDLFGRRRLLLVGIAVFTAASALCGVAPTFTTLVAARALQGAGAALMLALSVALVGDTVPKARTGSAMGLLGTMSALGTTLGPALGGVLIASLGWRAIFLVNVPLGLMNLWLAHRWLPDDRPAAPVARAAFDVPGTAVLGLALAAWALAMTTGGARAGALDGGLLLGAGLGAVTFVVVEARQAAPLVRLAMFRDPVLSASLAMSALVSTVMMSTLVVGPFYLARSLGLSPVHVGFALSAGPLVSALTGTPAGRLVDRLGPQRMAVAGLAIIAGAALLLALLPAQLGLAGYLGPIVVMTAGYATFQAANNTALMSNVDAQQRGVVSGMLSLSRNLGLITGASAMGAVFTAALGPADIATASPPAVAAGLHATFGVAAALIGIALAVAAASRLLVQRQASRTTRQLPV